jgi:hypothetical protein
VKPLVGVTEIWDTPLSPAVTDMEDGLAAKVKPGAATNEPVMLTLLVPIVTKQVGLVVQPGYPVHESKTKLASGTPVRVTTVPVAHPAFPSLAGEAEKIPSEGSKSMTLMLKSGGASLATRREKL